MRIIGRVTVKIDGRVVVVVQGDGPRDVGQSGGALDAPEAHVGVVRRVGLGFGVVVLLVTVGEAPLAPISQMGRAGRGSPCRPVRRRNLLHRSSPRNYYHSRSPPYSRTCLGRGRSRTAWRSLDQKFLARRPGSANQKNGLRRRRTRCSSPGRCGTCPRYQNGRRPHTLCCSSVHFNSKHWPQFWSPLR